MTVEHEPFAEGMSGEDVSRSPETEIGIGGEASPLATSPDTNAWAATAAAASGASAVAALGGPDIVALDQWMAQSRILHNSLFDLLDIILTALEPGSHTPRLRRALSNVRSRTRTPTPGRSPELRAQSAASIPALLVPANSPGSSTCGARRSPQHAGVSNLSIACRSEPASMGDSLADESPVEEENASDESTACEIAALLRAMLDVHAALGQGCGETSTAGAGAGAGAQSLMPSRAESTHSLAGTVERDEHAEESMGSNAFLLQPRVDDGRSYASLQRVFSAPALVVPPPAYPGNMQGEFIPAGAPARAAARIEAMRVLENRLRGELRIMGNMLPAGSNHDAPFVRFLKHLDRVATLLARRNPDGLVPSTSGLSFSTPTTPTSPGEQRSAALVGMLLDMPPSPSGSEAEALPMYSDLYPNTTHVEQSRRIRAAGAADGQPAPARRAASRDLAEQRWTDKRRGSCHSSSRNIAGPSTASGDRHVSFMAQRRHSIARTNAAAAAGGPRQYYVPTPRSRCLSTASRTSHALSSQTSLEPLLASSNRGQLSDQRAAHRPGFMTATRFASISKRYDKQRSPHRHLEAANLAEQITRVQRTRMEDQRLAISERKGMDMELARLTGHMERLNDRRLDDQQWHSPAQRLQRELERLASEYMKTQKSETREAFRGQRFVMDEGKKRDLFMKQVESRIRRLPRFAGQDAEFRV